MLKGKAARALIRINAAERENLTGKLYNTYIYQNEQGEFDEYAGKYRMNEPHRKFKWIYMFTPISR